jgi:hypothetical protein
VRPGLFVGRAGELARLDAALAGPGGVMVQAVHGLGGIGKSTLAAHWAAVHASDHTLTWWITAATPADIDAGLAALAVALQPAMSGVLPLEALREGAVQWLAAHQGWLLILDNVTDPADVAPLLARAPGGRYLITSRRATGWQRVLGQDHPHTLTSRGYLAYAYHAAGDVDRAIPLYEQALTDSARILGDDHPQTKIVRDNLAAARHQAQQ